MEERTLRALACMSLTWIWPLEAPEEDAAVVGVLVPFAEGFESEEDGEALAEEGAEGRSDC